MFAWLWSAAVLAAPAPALQVQHWVSPGPVTEAPLQVVEIWATWCGACRASFPELTALQRSYGERLRIIALTDDPSPVVARLFADQKDRMGFAVATTDPQTTQAFLFGGFGGRGIPSVYAIADGDVVWGGEPSGLRAVLAQRLGPPALPHPDPAP